MARPHGHTPRPLSILVVDDLPDAANSMAECLVLHGHRAVAVYGGEEALVHVAAHSTDVVLMDITMPGMDGFELAERVYKQSLRRRPFLVAVTARTSDADRQHGREVGFDMYLTKPIEPDLVSDMLDRIALMLGPASHPG
ncbi:response regulator [Limnoglobus roseus]|uniref:Response regulator n=1 Tax=Limnoglobus roseus TaxID=2598579 RepID=A0A5C1ADU4_9BACT|nr:response regulator [Limnoglobus roseus]QEL15238.1 response regulator [Limnoglobus roseus]